MMEEHTVVIIGGGPAGSACAMALRRRGVDVGILEKKRFPRDKVCGEFVAPLGVEELRRLGVLERVVAKGAHIVRRVHLYAPDGHHTWIEFEEGTFGLGVSRMTLDHALFDAARDFGARTYEGFRVVEVAPREGPLSRKVVAVEVRSGERRAFAASSVVNASGLKGVGTRRKDKRSPLYALKVYLRGVDCGDTTELFFYPGGYGGLVNVEGGLTTLAFQLPKEAFSSKPLRPLETLLGLMPPSHPVRRKLEGADGVVGWSAVGTTHLGAVVSPNGLWWNIGDASQIVHPFSGMGISLALQSGRFLGEHLEASRAREPYDVKTALNRKRLATINILGRVLFRPRLCRMAVKTSNGLPWLGRFFIRALHT